MGSTQYAASLSTIQQFVDQQLGNVLNGSPPVSNATLSQLFRSLSAINTNQNFVQSSPCSFNFTESTSPSSHPLQTPCSGGVGNDLSAPAVEPSSSGSAAQSDTLNVVAISVGVAVGAVAVIAVAALWIRRRLSKVHADSQPTF